MKINEFRDKIKRCRREELEKIASELYKMLPKGKKESDADPLIEDIISGVNLSVFREKRKAVVVDFESLKSQINHHIAVIN